MPSVQYDILIEQGATFSFDLTLKDANGDPRDLSGYSIRFQGKPRHRAPADVFRFTDSDPEITNGGANGTISISVSATKTATFPAPANGVYDLEIEAADGVVERIVEGEYRITPEV